MANKRILIADDDSAILEMLRMTLEAEGFDVETAKDGKEALQRIKDKDFDLLLLDIEMPYVDGYHLAQQISSTALASQAKIVFLTGRDTQKEKAIGALSGGVEMIQKPCDLDQLVKKIKQLLGN